MIVNDRLEPQTLRAAMHVFRHQASPRLLLGIISAVLIVRVAMGRYTIADLGTISCILVTWPLQERLFHEYFLHLRARHLLGRTLIRRLSVNHRLHHRDPGRLAMILIQPHAYYVILPVISAVSFVITDDTRLTLTAVAGFLSALAWYEWIHFLIHTPYVPRSNWYRRRWQNHRLHHFKNSRYWFGITSTLGDTLLGTRPPPLNVPQKWHSHSPHA
jgi:hypothetical protein